MAIGPNRVMLFGKDADLGDDTCSQELGRREGIPTVRPDLGVSYHVETDGILESCFLWAPGRDTVTHASNIQF